MFSFMHCFEKLRSGVCDMFFCLDIRSSICLASCTVLKSSDLVCVKSSDLVCVTCFSVWISGLLYV